MITSIKKREDVKEVNNRPSSITIGNIGKIKISKELKAQIDYLHRLVGAIEWSGILLYKLTSGNLSELKDLEFSAEAVYPMDIGSSAQTSFSYSADSVVQMYDLIPEAIDLNVGMIHTHHNMGAFISGTDFNDLMENSSAYNFYMSLVVDFAETYVCKLAIPSNTDISKVFYILDNDGNKVPISRNYEEKEILIGELTVEIAPLDSIPSWMPDKVSELKRIKYEEDRVKSKYASNKTATNTRFTPQPSVRDYDSDLMDFNRYLDEWDKPSRSFESTFNNKSALLSDINPKAKKPVTPIRQFISAILMGADFFTLDSLPIVDEVIEEFNTLSKIDLEIMVDSFDDNVELAFEMVYPNLSVTKGNVCDKMVEAYKELSGYKNLTTNMKFLKRMFFNYIKAYK